MFRFLHAADLHLDTQPTGLHGYPDEAAELLRDSSLRAFDNLVQEAITREVDFCLFAGDIYDGAERGARAELAFRRGLQRLADHGIRSFIVHGNHDPVEQGWSTVSEWPRDWVTVFEPGEPQTVVFEAGGTTVAVHGVSYAERATTDNLAVTFSRAHDAAFQVGLLHANVGGNTDHDPYAPCSVDDLRSVGLDYWALGHIHVRSNPCAGDPWAVYPGNLQGRHPKPSEQGAKGAVVVEVDDGTISPPELVPLDVLRFDSISVRIDELGDLGVLADALIEALDRVHAEHPGYPLVVRATLSGRGPAHALLAHGRTADDLLEQLRTDGLADRPLVWWDRLVVDTRPDVDLDALAEQDDFVGNALRAIDHLAADAGALDELVGELPDLSRLGVDAPDLADPDVVERARLLCVDRLLDGGGG